MVTNRNTLYPPIAVLDHAVDTTWAGTYTGATVSSTNNPYYDYFFTGQDIIVVVDGTEDDANFKVLPLLNMGFNVTQQKAPIYGFWSYTYDAVLRGTRLVQGSITLATKSPNYVKNLIAKSAQSRQLLLGSANYTYSKNLTEDDANIEKYWGKNIDPTLNALGTSIYSVHPPFSFVIIYGVQNISVSEWGNIETYQRYTSDNPWLADTNERLIESDIVNQSNRVILDACEIQSMETSYGPDGSIVAETYSFFGRDIISPQ
jgi:hypothetical protein